MSAAHGCVVLSRHRDVVGSARHLSRVVISGKIGLKLPLRHISPRQARLVPTSR
jgi:hypothetical protein